MCFCISKFGDLIALIEVHLTLQLAPIIAMKLGNTECGLVVLGWLFWNLAVVPVANPTVYRIDVDK